MESEKIKENRRKQLEKVISDLKSFGLDRRQIEKEINYTENSLDVSVSRAGSDKLLTMLNLLLETKILKRAINEKPDTESTRLVSLENKLEEIHKSILRVDENVIDSHAEILLVESLSRTVLYQTAYLETHQHVAQDARKDYTSRAAELNNASLTMFVQLQEKSSVLTRNKVA